MLKEDLKKEYCSRCANKGLCESDTPIVKHCLDRRDGSLRNKPKWFKMTIKTKLITTNKIHMIFNCDSVDDIEFDVEINNDKPTSYKDIIYNIFNF